MLKEILNSPFKKHQSSGRFSISSVGGCWRKKYLELKGLYKEEYGPEQIRTFAIGDLFHQMCMKELFEKCENNGYAIVASEVNIPTIDEAKNLSGRTDLIISEMKTGELTVCDFKSCSDWTFNKVLNGAVPQNYIDQVNLYLHLFKIKKGILLFMSKHKGKIAEVEVKYDEARAKQLIKEIDDFFNNYVNKNIELPKCTGRDFGCECCGYK